MLTCPALSLQDRPGLVVLTIELETALSQMLGSYSPSKMWSPYRAPLARFLCKYTSEVRLCWSVCPLDLPATHLALLLLPSHLSSCTPGDLMTWGLLALLQTLQCWDRGGQGGLHHLCVGFQTTG